MQVSGEKTLLLSSGAGDLVVAVTGGARPAVSAAIEGIKRDGITLPLVLAAAAPASGGTSRCYHARPNAAQNRVGSLS